jgi:hypothetical protein
MTSLGLELLSLFWPGIAAALFGGATYFWRQQSSRMDSLSKTLDQFRCEVRSDIARIEGDFSDHRIDVTHKIDKLIGATHARLVGIETTCEQQHGVKLRRRSTDTGSNWANDSDIIGKS